MTRTAIFAAALLAASLGSAATTANADSYVQGRVISAVPHLSLSFGSLRHDGFNITYDVGGQVFNTHRHVHPGRVIFVPQPHRVVKVIRHGDHRGDHWRGDDRRGWRDGDRRGWRSGDHWDNRRSSHSHFDDRGRGGDRGGKHSRSDRRDDRRDSRSRH